MKRIKKRNQPALPNPTQTFVDFAAPLLDTADGIEGARTAVRIATVCWNMGAMEIAGHPVFEEGLAQLAGSGTGSVEAFEFLVSRRVMDYGEHPWLVADATVTEHDGELQFRVTTRSLGD